RLDLNPLTTQCIFFAGTFLACGDAQAGWRREDTRMRKPELESISCRSKVSLRYNILGMAGAAVLPAISHAMPIIYVIGDADVPSGSGLTPDTTLRGTVDDTGFAYDDGSGVLAPLDFDFFEFNGFAPGTPVTALLNVFITDLQGSLPNIDFSLRGPIPDIFTFREFVFATPSDSDIGTVLSLSLSGTVGGSGNAIVDLTFNGIGIGSTYCVTFGASCTPLIPSADMPSPSTLLLAAGGLLAAGASSRSRRRRRHAR
ncbi:MAG: hypothetical protein AAF742_09625, partial [Pseudomonadota bacterium]